MNEFDPKKEQNPSNSQSKQQDKEAQLQFLNNQIAQYFKNQINLEALKKILPNMPEKEYIASLIEKQKSKEETIDSKEETINKLKAKFKAEKISPNSNDTELEILQDELEILQDEITKLNEKAGLNLGLMTINVEKAILGYSPRLENTKATDDSKSMIYSTKISKIIKNNKENPLSSTILEKIQEIFEDNDARNRLYTTFKLDELKPDKRNELESNLNTIIGQSIKYNRLHKFTDSVIELVNKIFETELQTIETQLAHKIIRDITEEVKHFETKLALEIKPSKNEQRR